MMVRPIRTSLLVSAVLGLGAGSALSAQTTRRPARAEASDSVERQLRRLERRADSLVRVYNDNDELSAAERRAVGDSLDRTIDQIDALARSLGLIERGMTPMAPMPPAFPDAELRMELAPSMMDRATTAMGHAFIRARTAQAAAPRGWMGIVVSGPALEPRFDNGELIVRYLTHPVIVSVDPSSPAERAGLAPSDTLLAYDGRDVRDADISLTKLLRPRARVMVRVRREGRTKEVPVVVADVPSRIKAQMELSFATRVPQAGGDPGATLELMRVLPPGAAPRARAFSAPVQSSYRSAPRAPMPDVIYGVGMSGVAGAQLYAVSEGIAKATGVPYGLFVAAAPAGTPAYQSGLRDGDIISQAAGEPVRTVEALRARVQAAAESGERSVALEIVREKRTQRVTLRWSGGAR